MRLTSKIPVIRFPVPVAGNCNHCSKLMGTREVTDFGDASVRHLTEHSLWASISSGPASDQLVSLLLLRASVTESLWADFSIARNESSLSALHDVRNLVLDQESRSHERSDTTFLIIASEKPLRNAVVTLISWRNTHVATVLGFSNRRVA